MRSKTLSGEVQEKDEYGIWRTILTATGHTVHDGWKMPHNWRQHSTPYVPGKVGAFRGKGPSLRFG